MVSWNLEMSLPIFKHPKRSVLPPCSHWRPQVFADDVRPALSAAVRHRWAQGKVKRHCIPPSNGSKCMALVSLHQACWPSPQQACYAVTWPLWRRRWTLVPAPLPHPAAVPPTAVSQHSYALQL